MSKPSYMSQRIYELLSEAIAGLDKASNAIDEALYEIDPYEVDEDDEVALAESFVVRDEVMEKDEVKDTFEEYKDEIEEMSYRLWVLIGEE